MGGLNIIVDSMSRYQMCVDMVGKMRKEWGGVGEARR